ncbi:MAG: hypothetical protein ABSE49_27025 [Polyangiaceae bacterium]|jgi:hypothetical protein
MPRRPSRPEILIPQRVTFSAPGSDRQTIGWIVRISIVGADIESLEPLPFGSEVDLVARFQDADVVLPGRVQCSSATQFGIQFGPLGARETHAILEAAESGGVSWEAYRRVA